jgi:hypothetical protein
MFSEVLAKLCAVLAGLRQSGGVCVGQGCGQRRQSIAVYGIV